MTDLLLNRELTRKIHPDFAKTITQFLIKEYAGFENQTELLLVFTQIQQACKRVSAAMRLAPLKGLYGKVGVVNAQGEEVQKLDVIANDHWIEALVSSEKVCLMVSEEDSDIIIPPKEVIGDGSNAPFVVCFDPLDGSSNIDVAVPVGSIFGIYKRKSKQEAKKEDALQQGRELIAAGYALYGSTSMLVVATKNGVNGFTQEPTSGEYVMTHPDMKIPQKGEIYSVNGGNFTSWNDDIKNYFTAKQQQQPKPYSQRYVGSMVADMHRTLLKGGIFCYPKDKKSPNGKLRLLYECNPMAFIVEKAGGKAVNGEVDILDIQPSDIHQRVPIYIGSPFDVDELLKYTKGVKM